MLKQVQHDKTNDYAICATGSINPKNATCLPPVGTGRLDADLFSLRKSQNGIVSFCPVWQNNFMSRKKSKSPKPVPTDFYQRSKQKSPTPSQSKGEQPPSGNPDIVKHLLPILLILIISIAIYSNTLKNGFVYYDEFTIVNNTLIKNFSNISKLFTKEYFTTSAEMSYRPVVTFTYFIDYSLYGIKPWGYHLTNLILHAMNGVILYIFLTLFIQPSQSSIFKLLSPPLLISLLFITHPVLTEAVNAISFREDGLCFLFFISALIPYIVHRSLLIAHCSKFKAFCFQLLSLSFYLLALLSKEMAITFPLIIILYEWIYGKKIESPQTSPPLQKGRVRVGSLFNPYIIGYIAITCFYLYLRFFLFHNPVEETLHGWLLSERLMTLPYLILKYLLLLIAPVSLSADYVITPVNSPFSLIFIVSVFVVILLLITIYKSRQSNVGQGFSLALSFGISFFLLTMLPVYNAIPIVNPFAERYLYLPMVGFSIIVGVGIHRIFTIKPASPIGGGGGGEGWFFKRQNLYILATSILILCIYSFAVIQRNKIWLNGYSLWSDIVRKMPESSKAHYNMGNASCEQGQLDEAIKELKLALSLKPDYAEAHNGLGITYAKQGQLDEAIKEYTLALTLKSNFAEAHNNLGNVYEKQGQLDEAIKEYKLALTINPDFAEAHNNLGNVYFKQGRIEDAIKEYQIAIELKPDYPTAHINLGNAYDDKGWIKDAIKEYQIAIELKPDFVEAYNNLGLVYSKQGKFDDAIKNYLIAIRIKPELPEAYGNLGIAYNMLGQVDEAIKAYLTLLKLNPDDADAHFNLAGFYHRKIGRA